MGIKGVRMARLRDRNKFPIQHRSKHRSKHRRIRNGKKEMITVGSGFTIY